MSILEPPQETQAKSHWLIWGALLLVVMVGAMLWYGFRYYPEERAVGKFFDALVAGDTGRAYQVWQPGPNYKTEDFLAEWGPNGFYGPVKSYKVVSAEAPRHGGSGVIVTVEISPYSPMPAAEDIEKSRRTREVRLWVEFSNKSIDFAPPL
jgi:hypothetical protein